MSRQKKATNTENFNELLRRTSDRLRGGSVPPPDSEPTVERPVDSSQRGRGRGRGGRRTGNSGRGPSPSANVTPVVTLTPPENDTNVISNQLIPPQVVSTPAKSLPANPGVVSTVSASPSNTGTLVIHAGELIARDLVILKKCCHPWVKPPYVTE